MLTYKNVVMSGSEIYKLLSKRDHSGSDKDIYAQDLQYFHTQAVRQGKLNEFYKLIEKAEKQGKNVGSKYNPEDGVLYDELPFDSIAIV